MLHVKTQLDSRSNLINILPARTSGANELFFYLALSDDEIGCNDQHVLSLLTFQSKLKSIVTARTTHLASPAATEMGTHHTRWRTIHTLPSLSVSIRANQPKSSGTMKRKI